MLLQLIPVYYQPSLKILSYLPLQDLLKIRLLSRAFDTSLSYQKNWEHKIREYFPRRHARLLSIQQGLNIVNKVIQGVDQGNGSLLYPPFPIFAEYYDFDYKNFNTGARHLISLIAEKRYNELASTPFALAQLVTAHNAGRSPLLLVQQLADPTLNAIFTQLIQDFYVNHPQAFEPATLENPYTILLLWIILYDTPLCEKLFKPKKNPTDFPYALQQPILYAAYCGNLAMVNFLLANAHPHQPLSLKYALIIAIKSNQHAIVKTLLLHCEKHHILILETVDKAHETPLHNAILYSDVAMVRLLILHQAPLTKFNNKKLTPLELAVAHCETAKVAALLEQPTVQREAQRIKKRKTLLHTAVENVDIATLVDLLHYANVNEQAEADDNTALHLAFQCEDAAKKSTMIDLLMIYKPNLNLRNAAHESVFDLAVKQQNKKFILEHLEQIDLLASVIRAKPEHQTRLLNFFDELTRPRIYGDAIIYNYSVPLQQTILRCQVYLDIERLCNQERHTYPDFRTLLNINSQSKEQPAALSEIAGYIDFYLQSQIHQQAIADMLPATPALTAARQALTIEIAEVVNDILPLGRRLISLRDFLKERELLYFCYNGIFTYKEFNKLSARVKKEMASVQLTSWLEAINLDLVELQTAPATIRAQLLSETNPVKKLAIKNISPQLLINMADEVRDHLLRDRYKKISYTGALIKRFFNVAEFTNLPSTLQDCIFSTIRPKNENNELFFKIIYAVYTGNLATLNDLMTSDPWPKNLEIDVVIALAMQRNHYAIVKSLILYFFKLDTESPLLKTPLRNTPLHSAILFDDLKMLRLVLRHQKKHSALNAVDLTPLHIAVNKSKVPAVIELLKHPTVRKELKGKNPTNPALHTAVRNADIAMLSLLLPHANVNVQNQTGNTALHLAFQCKDTAAKEAMINLLMPYRPDVNVCNAYGQIPFHYAVLQSNHRFIFENLPRVNFSLLFNDVNEQIKDAMLSLFTQLQCHTTEQHQIFIKYPPSFQQTIVRYHSYVLFEKNQDFSQFMTEGPKYVQEKITAYIDFFMERKLRKIHPEIFNKESNIITRRALSVELSENITSYDQLNDQLRIFTLASTQAGFVPLCLSGIFSLNEFNAMEMSTQTALIANDTEKWLTNIRLTPRELRQAPFATRQQLLRHHQAVERLACFNIPPQFLLKTSVLVTTKLLERISPPPAYLVPLIQQFFSIAQFAALPADLQNFVLEYPISEHNDLFLIETLKAIDCGNLTFIANSLQNKRWPSRLPYSSAFTFAIERNHYALVEAMILYFCSEAVLFSSLLGETATKDLNNRNTPLHCAVRYGDSKMVQLLLRYQALVSCRNADHLTPLELAVSKDKCEIVATLLTHPAIQQEARETKEDRDTLLHMAVARANPEILKLLLQYVDVNEQSNTKDTALHFAFQCPHPAEQEMMIASLMSYRPNLNLRNLKNETPFTHALYHKVEKFILRYIDQIDFIALLADPPRYLKLCFAHLFELLPPDDHQHFLSVAQIDLQETLLYCHLYYQAEKYLEFSSAPKPDTLAPQLTPEQIANFYYFYMQVTLRTNAPQTVNDASFNADLLTARRALCKEMAATYVYQQPSIADVERMLSLMRAPHFF